MASAYSQQRYNVVAILSSSSSSSSSRRGTQHLRLLSALPDLPEDVQGAGVLLFVPILLPL
jgi:hypothetical protein